MSTLTDMMVQFVNNMSTTSQQQWAAEINLSESTNRNPKDAVENSHCRQSSLKENANTLPEYDPGDEKIISVNQFIDRVNKVVDAYQ
ncbi:hypothetical protein KR038_003817, partial [Drosophila bunnanda]